MASPTLADKILEYPALVTAEAATRAAADATRSFADLGAAADAAALAPTESGGYTIATVAAETNTLAAPDFLGQVITFICVSYAVGNRVITSAGAINQAGNTIMTFGAVGDFIELLAVDSDGAGTLLWRVRANDGVALS